MQNTLSFLRRTFLLAGILLILAQPSRAIKDFRVKHFTTQMGLSQSSVISILQDQEGLIWFGTEDGINKFDGYGFEVFKHNLNDEQSLYSNYIKCIFEDSEGTLWVGTTRGVNRFDRIKNKFIRATEFPRFKTNAIAEDTHGNLWVGSQNLYIKNKITGRVDEYFPDPKFKGSISEGIVNTIFKDSKNRMWVGTLNGLNIYDYNSNSFSKFYHTKKNNSLNSNDIRCISEDLHNRLWVGTDAGLNLMPNSNDSIPDNYFVSFENDKNHDNSILPGSVLALQADSDMNLWIGIENGGLNIISLRDTSIDNLTIQRYTFDALKKDGLGNNSIQSLYEDKQKNIWIGTFSAGVDQFSSKSKKFDYYYFEAGNTQSLNNSQVNTFYEDDTNIWIGTEGGLNLLNKESKQFHHFTHDPSDRNSIGSNAIWCIYKDRKEQIWIGTWGGGLNLFNEKNGTFKRYLLDPNNSKSIQSNNIFSILEDDDGNLWIGTMGGGLSLFDPAEQSFKTFSNANSKIATNFIESIIQSGPDQLIIANTTDVLTFNTKSHQFKPLINYREEGLNIDQLLTSCFLESDSLLWIGSEIGLLAINKNKQVVKLINENSGLPNNSIKSIAKDRNGCLWVGSNKGLSRISPDYKITNYTIEDGLQANEFSRRSVLISQSGKLYFGGVNGFNSFFPDSIKENDFLPKVLFSDFTLGNQSVIINNDNSPLKKHISQTNSIVLSHQQSSIGFKFVALNYISPSKNKYAYRLKGFDKDWVYSNNKREVNYTNLNPGQYTFMVKASNNDGIWNEIPTQIEILIKPPLWKTQAAYLFYIILGAFALYLFRYYTIIGFEEKNNLQLEHLENAKKEEVTQSKLQFFTNLSHEIRTPLTLIRGPIEDIIHKNNTDKYTLGQIEVVDRNTKRLVYLINQLLDFRKIDVGNAKLLASEHDLVGLIESIIQNFNQSSERLGIQIHFHSEHKHLKLWYDQQKIVSVMYNLLSNACKAIAEGGDINIYLKIKSQTKHNNKWKWKNTLSKKKISPQEFVEITIQDTGIGIPKDQLDSIFTRFHQVLEKPNYENSGSGIGLNIVHNYIKLHTGVIWAESEIGHGSSFIFQLPLGQEHLSQEQIIENKDMAKPNLPPLTLNLNDAVGESKEEPKQFNQTNSTKALALVVEDHADLRQYMEQQLTNDYEIVTAKNGVEGLALAQQLDPSIIITDLMMPKMDGIELTKRLKSDLQTSHIPVIVLTAKSGDENMIEGVESGADVYLTKPFSMALLKAYLITLLDARQKIKDKYLQSLSLEPKAISVSGTDEQFLAQLMEIMEREMANAEFNVTELCEELPVSYRTLVRKIKALTGQTATEFIRTIRLKAAAQLLKDKQVAIAEIAFLTGFNDPAYFSRCFHKHFGISPTQFASGNNNPSST